MLTLVTLVHAHGNPALAQDPMMWSFSEGNDPNNRGRMTARLGLDPAMLKRWQARAMSSAHPGAQ